MSFIYCSEDDDGSRWFYQESPGFREKVPGSSSSLTREKAKAYHFESKTEAWEHCRQRRRGGQATWGPRKWVVIKMATPEPSNAPGDAPKEKP